MANNTIIQDKAGEDKVQQSLQHRGSEDKTRSNRDKILLHFLCKYYDYLGSRGKRIRWTTSRALFHGVSGHAAISTLESLRSHLQELREFIQCKRYGSTYVWSLRASKEYEAFKKVLFSSVVGDKVAFVKKRYFSVSSASREKYACDLSVVTHCRKQEKATDDYDAYDYPV